MDHATALVRAVLVHGPIARSALGERLGLSPASLTRIAKPLVDGGLLVERVDGADGVRGVGRPGRPLDVEASAACAIGVKLSGDAAMAVLTDARANILAEHVAALGDLTPAGVVATVTDVVGALRAEAQDARLVGVGLSIGGNVEGGVVTRAPFLGWHDVPLAALVEDAVGVPTSVANDVTALAEAERWFGAGRGDGGFAVLTIGAGVGFGLVVHDAVVAEADTGLGLAGHIPLLPDGPECDRGHRGCSAVLLTEGGMLERLAGMGGGHATYAELLERARRGEDAAASVVDEAARALGTLMGLVANLAMRSTIVLAGEGVGLWGVGEARAREALAAMRHPDAAEVRVLIDDAGYRSWARGAAAVAIQDALPRLVGAALK